MWVLHRMYHDTTTFRKRVHVQMDEHQSIVWNKKVHWIENNIFMVLFYTRSLSVFLSFISFFNMENRWSLWIAYWNIKLATVRVHCHIFMFFVSLTIYYWTSDEQSTRTWENYFFNFVHHLLLENCYNSSKWIEKKKIMRRNQQTVDILANRRFFISLFTYHLFYIGGSLRFYIYNKMRFHFHTFFISFYCFILFFSRLLRFL